MIIGVDGGVATGKTTLCRAIAERCGGSLFAEYPPHPEESSAHFDGVQQRWQMQTHYLERETERARRAGDDGVLDRTIVSQAAHVYALAASSPWDLRTQMRAYLSAVGSETKVVTPDVLLFLADDGAAMERLQLREASANRRGTATYLLADEYRLHLEGFLRRIHDLIPTSTAVLLACPSPERAEAALVGLRPVQNWLQLRDVILHVLEMQWL